MYPSTISHNSNILHKIHIGTILRSYSVCQFYIHLYIGMCRYDFTQTYHMYRFMSPPPQSRQRIIPSPQRSFTLPLYNQLILFPTSPLPSPSLILGNNYYVLHLYNKHFEQCSTDYRIKFTNLSIAFKPPECGLGLLSQHIPDLHPHKLIIPAIQDNSLLVLVLQRTMLCSLLPLHLCWWHSYAYYIPSLFFSTMKNHL